MKTIVNLFVLLMLTIRLFAQEWKSLGLENEFIKSIAVDPIDINVIYVCSGNGIFKTTNGGTNWNKIKDNSITEIKIDLRNPRIVYAYNAGYICKSTDYGNTWKDDNKGIDTKIFSGITAFELNSNEPEILYCGVGGIDKGSPYISTNGGENWNKLGPNTEWYCYRSPKLDTICYNPHNSGITAISINPQTNNTIYLATQTSLILKTHNSGKSWVVCGSLPEDLITDIEVDEADTNLVYCSTYSSGYFFSKNGGKTWEPLFQGIRNGHPGKSIQASSIAGKKIILLANVDYLFKRENDGLWQDLQFNRGEIGSLLLFDKRIYVGAKGLFVKDILTNIAEHTDIPFDFYLYQTYPNPFNPLTTIKFHISKISDITIAVYDVLGRKIKTLLDSNVIPGTHSLTWNGTDTFNNKVNTGIYFVSLIVEGRSYNRKMVLMK